MKSLTFNLFAISIPLLLVANSSYSTSLLATPSATVHKRTTPSHTTTTAAPSLKAPKLQVRRHTIPSSSAASTSSPTLVTASRQRQRANTSTTMRKPILAEATTLASTRLVRRADTTTQANAKTRNLRQNRSFQSAISSASTSNTNDGFMSASRKHKTNERRHQLRQQPLAITDDSIITNSTVVNPSNSHRQTKNTFLPAIYKASDMTTTKPMKIEHNQQIQKTPRMIQRLVAGHIQNSQGRSSYEISAITTNSTTSKTTTATTESKPSAATFRRRPMVNVYTHKQQQQQQQPKAAVNLGTTAATITTTTKKPVISQNTIKHSAYDDRDYDEALLNDSEDFDNWDHGILRLSAGSGKEHAGKSKKSKEDSKKTLADQVRDGKYGLIEKELFRKPPKRPGVLSYLPNKEVPHDNERNFGGLNEEDIWLAEDHLLVIKGGSLNEDNPEEPWPPIDDYVAPGRQIKIAANPKIPPPFPVQLEENGPVQLIGNNKLTVVYPIANESLSIYSVGKETYNKVSESDSDDEKNFIARPGTFEDAKENEPSYNYPTTSPPWLYHNQTFVNPSLNRPRPVSFPYLGPFLFGRNGSLDNINNTEDFDEDDPSLYYPPAYSFVYKSNYTNPVLPGPLVPGIVVPPPPNHFSRLDKATKERKTYTTTSSPPTYRYRVHGVTSLSTTSTTSTTTTTAPEPSQVPFRHAITKISEYTPKTINIVSPRPKPNIYNSLSSSRLPSAPPSTPSPQLVEPVPVPVAVPIPIYPVNYEPTSRPIVTFVPTTPETNDVDTVSKGNPIYYEYFEAKRQPTVSNVIEDFISTTSKPSSFRNPVKLYATQKRPYKQLNHHRNYQQTVTSNRPYDHLEENVVVITPKPDVRYNVRPFYRVRPLTNFEQEVDTLRDALRFYQSQELRDNSIPRTPKAKAVFDYNFDGSKSGQINGRNKFQPPSAFDDEPFKPMVTYSPQSNDDNAFQALRAEKTDSQRNIESKYPSTTLLPGPPQSRTKKLRLRAKYLQQPAAANYQQHTNVEYGNELRQPIWVAVNKQELHEYTDHDFQAPNERQPDALQVPVPFLNTRTRDFPGYYYNSNSQQQQQQQSVRQNNRFYEEPFHQIPNRKFVGFRGQQPIAQTHGPVWSLENDTYVNYASNRPPVNPDAEFINPYQGNLPYQGQRLPSIPAPAFSHQSQYFTSQQQHRLPPRHYQLQSAPPSALLPQQQPQQVPLHRDILVNYRQPLPPINPDSEYISHPQVVRNQAKQIFRPTNYRLQPPNLPSIPANANSDVYYLTPKYRRANSNNNNNSNSDNNNHNNNNSNSKANKSNDNNNHNQNLNNQNNNSDNNSNSNGNFGK
ncbi:uncharacterized protein ACN2A1_010699 isoform 1-T17 [Glossina fuscipes fuscipes]